MEDEGFGELIYYTLPGYIGGLLTGWLLDFYGYSVNPIGQWLVRTLSGEGETILEGIYSLRKSLGKAEASLSIAYGWGKVLGLVFPWIIDILSRMMGVNMFNVESFYIPYLYGLSDQIGANVLGFYHFVKREKSTQLALRRYLKNPVMVSSLMIILLAPIGLFILRYSGFSPRSQVLVAFETIIVNLCWIPPIIGKYTEDK